MYTQILTMLILRKVPEVAANSGQFPQKCRGIYFGDYGQPVYEGTNKIPNKPRRDHLIIQVHAVGVNPVDAKHLVGDKLPHDKPDWHKKYHQSKVKDAGCGFDFAGIVVAASKIQRTKYPFGTRVYGITSPFDGSFAEYIQVPASQVAKAPDHLSLEECAALPLVGLTAIQALSPFVVPNQSRVLVVGGSGGTGHVSIQVARALGAKDIVTICSTRNVEFVKECGANRVVDYTTTDDIIEELKSMTHPEGKDHDEPFDLVMDCVTSGDPGDAQHNYPARIRNPSAGIVAESTHLYQRLGGKYSDWIRALFARQKMIPRSWVWKDTRERLFWIDVNNTADQLKELAKWADDGKLKPKVQKIYPELTAESVQQAFDDMNGRRVQGKVVISVVQKN